MKGTTGEKLWHFNAEDRRRYDSHYRDCFRLEENPLDVKPLDVNSSDQRRSAGCSLGNLGADAYAYGPHRHLADAVRLNY